MAETYPWKALFRQRVASVDADFCTIRGLLTAVQPELVSTMHMGTAEAWSALMRRFRIAENQLNNASTILNRAIFNIDGAELLALRGGGTTPTVPLPSIDHLRDDDRTVRLALAKLKDAKALAEDAINGVERCRGHLSAAVMLLGHPGIPGMVDCVEAQRLAAAGVLDGALDQAVKSAWLANTARENAFGVNREVSFL